MLFQVAHLCRQGCSAIAALPPRCASEARRRRSCQGDNCQEAKKRSALSGRQRWFGASAVSAGSQIPTASGADQERAKSDLTGKNGPLRVHRVNYPLEPRGTSTAEGRRLRVWQRGLSEFAVREGNSSRRNGTRSTGRMSRSMSGRRKAPCHQLKRARFDLALRKYARIRGDAQF